MRDEFRQFADGQVAAIAHVDERRTGLRADKRCERVVGEIGEEDAAVRHVVDEEELPVRPTRPEHDYLVATLLFSFVGLSKKRGEYVAGLEIVAVARPVEIGRHYREKSGSCCLL